MQWMPRSEILTFEEIERLARICVQRFGFDGIRLTGGEPTMRAHLTTLVSKLANIDAGGRPVDLAMTTNGATLRHCAHDLRVAGLKRINISLDTLDRAKFERMTRRDELDHVLLGIQAAQDAGFSPVKINVVVERGVNDDEIVDLARFGRDQGSRCGSSSSCRSTRPMPGSAPRWSGRTRSSPRSPPSGRSSRCRLVVRRRPTAGGTSTARGTVGRDPDGHQAVLRRLRPGAAHRRRPVPHLPVRHRRVRPPCRAAVGRERRPDRRPHRGRRRHEVGRVTRSTR